MNDDDLIKLTKQITQRWTTIPACPLCTNQLGIKRDFVAMETIDDLSSEQGGKKIRYAQLGCSNCGYTVLIDPSSDGSKV